MIALNEHFVSLFESSVEGSPSYVLIPGAFRPPHKGHYEMIKHYAENIGKNGTCYVFISNPSERNQRTTSTGSIISAETAKEILQIYCKNIQNIKFIIAKNSPVKAVYDFPNDFNITEGIIAFGCSKKDDDIRRFKNIQSFYAKNYPNLVIIDPEISAFEPLKSESDDFISASQFREHFDDPEAMKKFIPDHLSDNEKTKVIKLLKK